MVFGKVDFFEEWEGLFGPPDLVSRADPLKFPSPINRGRHWRGMNPDSCYEFTKAAEPRPSSQPRFLTLGTRVQ